MNQDLCKLCTGLESWIQGPPNQTLFAFLGAMVPWELVSLDPQELVCLGPQKALRISRDERFKRHMHVLDRSLARDLKAQTFEDVSRGRYVAHPGVRPGRFSRWLSVSQDYTKGYKL